MTEVQNLEALEQRAEKALEKAETGWREFAQTMREIKESEAHKQAGYRYFQPYYRARWQGRAGKSFDTADNYVEAIRSVEEMEAAVEGRVDLPDLPPIGNVNIGRHLRTIEDAEERARFWTAFAGSGEPVGVSEQNLRTRIREHKTGVIERLEDAGVEIPPYPEGPSDEEVAYRKFSDLAAVAKDVTPEAAARAVSSSTAYSVAPSYDFLLPWVRGFLAELHLRAGR